MRGKFLITVLSVACLLVGCSPPGSGDGAGGPEYDAIRGATVSMTVNPQEIGVGEIADVRVHIERINPAGVLVILRYPSSYLNYLTDSSYLEVDGEAVNVSPVFGPKDRARLAYQVYYFPEDVFQGNNEGVLTLHLLGQHRNKDVLIEVDAHLHDVAKLPQDEFSLRDPNFSADDAQHLSILTSN